MYSVTLLLKLIPHDAPLTWRDFLAPFEEEGPLDPFEKAALQLQAEALASIELVTIKRTTTDARLHPADTLQLTALGAERARESLKGEAYVHSGTTRAT